MLTFDNWLTNYTWIGFGLVWVAAAFYYNAALTGPDSRLPVNGYWVVVFCGLLLFMRLPFITYNHELDIDESQMLAQAMGLKRFWVHWKFVDGLTQGPLTSYALIVPSWLGLPFDYTAGRSLGVVMLFFTLSATFLGLRDLFRKTVALAAFTPVAFFYLLSQGAFSTLYNEYLVLFLLALCFRLFSTLYRRPRPQIREVSLLGFLAGMVPFAKLQGAPTALVIVVFAAVIIYHRSPDKVKMLACFVAAGMLFPMLVLGFTIRYGVLDNFWQFYIIGNMEYSSGGSIWVKAMRYPRFLRQSGQFLYFFACNLALTLCAVVQSIRTRTPLRSPGLLFWFGLCHVATAFYVVVKSGYLFPHYQQFLIIPLSIFAGSLAEIALGPLSPDRRLPNTALPAWMLVCFLPHLVSKWATVTARGSVSGTRISVADLGKPISVSPVARTVLRFARPGDLLTVWGWHPAYHLETRLSQGTADVIPFRVLTEGPPTGESPSKIFAGYAKERPGRYRRPDHQSVLLVR
ncbi:hypothetical protein [Dyadobacter sp. 676]|uniref:Glycosyltransferase RgtA/B/C/D-like domain-containing protein n=1 Tax=Dyadobacter sp. 676 TaxID=3088362 RepID=A0AAU8FG89_9BACT